MTAYSWLRNATILAAVAMLGTSAAFAIDPARGPRNTEPIVPNPQDPYWNPNGQLGQFDPFAPNPNVNPTLPANSQGAKDLRISPNVVQPAPQPAEPSRWRLGIFSTDTGTGVQIVKVVERSPAAAAGLEQDDTIVNVSGYQVGYVHNHRHELGQAFNEYADTDGYVVLLVHDNRSGNLINLPVTLESRLERIQGTIGFQAGTRLPANAVAQVALHEILSNGVVVPLVTKTVSNIQTTPVPFTLEVDPSLVSANRRYVVHADIRAAQQTLYTTRNEYRVLTDGYPRTVDMRLYPTTTTGGGQYNGYADNRDDQLAQIAKWYQEYLHRDPRYNERDVWQSHIDRGGSLSEVQADLLAHNEFYTQADRDDRQYIENMYLAVLGRRPQTAEVDAWIKQLAARNGLRREIAREFLAQVSKQR